SICWRKNAGETSKMADTPVVFCAVRAVMAVMAYTPLAIMVLISAWMPAPPLESLPAMESAVFMSRLLKTGNGLIRQALQLFPVRAGILVVHAYNIEP